MRCLSRSSSSGSRRSPMPLRITCLSIISTCIASSSWTCILDSVPAKSIPLNDGNNEQRSGPLFVRHLRSSSDSAGGKNNDATVLSEGYATRRTNVPRLIDENGTTATSVDEVDVVNLEKSVTREGRECTCATDADAIPTDRIYYCPLPTNRCTVRSRYSRSSGRRRKYDVECYESKNWMIGYARSIWFWLCFAWLLLVLYPIFSRPGQHAVRYLLSKCFPRMNPWIAERLLQTEIEARNHISDEFENFARLKRRTEGWITGYRIKTKVYSSGDDGIAQNEGGCSGGGDGKCGELCESNCNGVDKAVGEGGESADNAKEREEVSQKQEIEECMCTICILPLEDGDRVADLSCGHLYHVDCLSEWIVKKNSCPLCQGPVAKEIRSFETDSSVVTNNNSSSNSSRGSPPKSILSQCRNHVTDSLTDIATGRDRRIHLAHHARIRSMLLAESESRYASLEDAFGEESGGAWSADRSFFRRRWE